MSGNAATWKWQCMCFYVAMVIPPPWRNKEQKVNKIVYSNKIVITVVIRIRMTFIFSFRSFTHLGVLYYNKISRWGIIQMAKDSKSILKLNGIFELNPWEKYDNDV